jgi:catechol 2,3-dioxygenase-like lactoylglutathione lyase family enzyme
VDRAIAFYTQQLGFRVKLRPAPDFALVTRGDLNLILSGPGTSGARPMPDGRPQVPGGWNRIVVYVERIDSAIAALANAGARFRNKVEEGPGGKQVLVEDPDGNPVELHEAPELRAAGRRVRPDAPGDDPKQVSQGIVVGYALGVSVLSLSTGRMQQELQSAKHEMFGGSSGSHTPASGSHALRHS